MVIQPNWIADTNRFKLAGPPKWFLAQLWDFDNSLVIIPSRQGFYYRLAQRRKLRLPEHITNEALWNESDTRMLATYGLVPVTTILATVNWGNPLLFPALAERSPSRMGGSEKVIKNLEAGELVLEQKTQAAIDEHLSYLGKDAWKLYRKNIGLGRSWNITPAAVRKSTFRTPVKRSMTGFSRPDFL